MKRQFSENYLVELSAFHRFEPEFRRDAIFSKELQGRFLDLQRSGEKNLFFDSKLNLRQGAYLTPVSPILMDLFDLGFAKIAGGRTLTSEI